MKHGFFCFCFLLFIGCQPLVPIHEKNFVFAVGTASISAQVGETLEDKKFRAMQASKLQAYKELTEQVYGVQISSQMQIYDQGLMSDSTSGTVHGIIRAAKVVTSYQISDSYVTELELNLDKMKKMATLGQSYHVPRDDSVIF